MSGEPSVREPIGLRGTPPQRMGGAEIEPGTPEAERFELELSRLGRNRAPDRFLDAVIDGEISTGLMRELILHVWTGAEIPLRAICAGNPEDAAVFWRAMFKATGFVTDTEQIPPMPLKVFRGAPLDDPKGFSWSWAESKAEWFAKRYQLHLDRPCGIFSITVERGDLLGVSTARGGAEGEREVILDPRTLTGRLEPGLERELQPEASWAA